MAEEWAGFTDEDLKNLGKGSAGTKRSGSRGLRGGHGNDVNKRRPQRAVPPMKKVTTVNSASSNIDPSMRLTTPAPNEPANSPHPPTVQNDPSAAQDKTSEATEVVSNSTENKDGVTPVSPSSTATSRVKEKELLDDDQGRDREMSNLKHYQEQQKMMEELNKQKKKMLSSALAQRQKAAHKEASKLKTINLELSRLDQSLNVDVSVIRDRIEQATRDYADASKRYEQAENEYVAAKINLHKKSELKEQLTEHLYTIIHQNELRKAKKLADLMKELELLDNSGLEYPLPELPSLSLLGNIQTVASGNLKHSEPEITSPTTPTGPKPNTEKTVAQTEPEKPKPSSPEENDQSIAADTAATGGVPVAPETIESN